MSTLASTAIAPEAGSHATPAPAPAPRDPSFPVKEPPPENDPAAAPADRPAPAPVDVKDGEGHETSPNGQRYVKLDVLLGSGAYKDVWRAYDTREGIEVAWNVIKLKRIPVNDRKRVKNEVLLLKEIEHKNIIKYHSSWIDREKQCVIFITEIMSSGSLKEYLRKNPMVRWKAVKRWCLQILDGLSFLHSKHIIHRDIKCDNIFINGSTGDIRIGDLGLSTRIGLRDGLTGPSGGTTSSNDEDEREITTETMTCLGTPEFMAPELYDENYDVKVDIYAFGMSCLEMITALTPYHLCTSAAQIFKKVSKGELPPELVKVYNRNARAFITACLQPHDMRPSAAQLLEHDFLQEKEAEDFKFVRGKLGSGGLEEVQEEDEENGEATAGDNRLSIYATTSPTKSLGLNLAASSVSSPSRATLSLGSVPISAQQEDESQHENVTSVLALDTDKKRVTNFSEDGRSVLSDAGTVKTSEPSAVGKSGACSPPIAAAQLIDRSTGRSRGSSGEGNGMSRSRILRVQTRSGSASGTDLRPSPGLGSHRLDDLIERSPIPRAASEPADLSAKGEMNRPVMLPVAVSALSDIRNRNDLCDAESNLPRRFLSSATVFDLLEIAPSDLLDHEQSTEAGVNNEALIFMMAVPVSDEDSYKEVEFEFNLLADEPSVLVEEMQTDPDLMDIIKPFANNIVSVLTVVCDVAKRVAKDRIETGDFTLPLSDAVLREILKMRQENGSSYAHFVECDDDDAFDPLAALCLAAKARQESCSQPWGLSEHDKTNGGEYGSITDAEADKFLLKDVRYQELMSTLQDNINKTSKEFERTKNSLCSQRDKLEDNFKRETEQCIARRSDLNLQLEDMQRKLKERMLNFSNVKEQMLSRQREKKLQRKKNMNMSTKLTK